MRHPPPPFYEKRDLPCAQDNWRQDLVAMHSTITLYSKIKFTFTILFKKESIQNLYLGTVCHSLSSLSYFSQKTSDQNGYEEQCIAEIQFI